MLQDMLETQAEFQVHELMKYFPDGKIDKDALHHSLCSHLISEAQELMDCVPWMLHKPVGRGQSTRLGKITEMVDVFKWLMNLMILHGVSAEEFYEVYNMKSTVVCSRCDANDFVKSRPGPCLILDLDGVLVDRDSRLLAFLNQGSKPHLQATSISYWKKREGLAAYEKAKHDFYEGPGFTDCPEIQETVSLIKQATDIPIVILTARDVRNHPRLHFDTIEWLDNHSICYKALICMADKAKALVGWCHKESVFVDDEREHVEAVSTVCHAWQYENPSTVAEAIEKVRNARR